jgi:GT2 family glycosyltransferase
MPHRPTASVVLPAWNSHETIAACLESLRNQRFRDFEVIVVDSSPGEQTAQRIRDGFPEVRLIRSGQRLWPHAARNLGAAAAQGDILVFSDPDCLMSPQWLERLVQTQRLGCSVAGGSVSNARRGWFLDGVHVCKYAWWLPGGRPGRRPELPSANVSYSQSLFARVGPFPEPWCGDTLLAQRAAAAGSTPWFEPEAEISHDHRTSFAAFLTERFQRGYDFGLVRPKTAGWHAGRSLAYAAASPFIVIWMLAAAFRYAAAARHVALFVRSLPIVAMGYAARQAGEAIGLWSTVWRRR